MKDILQIQNKQSIDGYLSSARLATVTVTALVLVPSAGVVGAKG
jgi:hypothetical protein